MNSWCCSILGELDESAAMAEQIVEMLGRRFQIKGHQIVVGASVGIAVAPRDGDSADLLLKNADMALYRVKLNGRGSWQFFEQGMDVRAHARRNLQMDLRKRAGCGGLPGPLSAALQPAHQAHRHL